VDLGWLVWSESPHFPPLHSAAGHNQESLEYISVLVEDDPSSESARNAPNVETPPGFDVQAKLRCEWTLAVTR
jgi:hypothetical protein